MSSTFSASASVSRSSPLVLRGHTLPNRLVVPPMASGTANEQGLVTPATLAHYERLGTARPGLLFVEYSFVHLSGRSEPNQLGVACDDTLPGLTALAETIHASGAVAGFQITHAGGKSDRSVTDGTLMAPSAVPVPVRDREMPEPSPMSQADIPLWRSHFVAAAHRVARTGFDLVEIHAAHGYGINQFLSPLTNHRTDSYGGSLANRMGLLLEVVAQIRTELPSLLIAVRMPGQDFLVGGLTQEDGLEVARTLERAGVDLLDVSSGIGGWRRPRDRQGEGYLVEEAAFIGKQVHVPVIGVGGIKTHDFIVAKLQEGGISLAAVGRSILEDPVRWAL